MAVRCLLNSKSSQTLDLLVSIGGQIVLLSALWHYMACIWYGLSNVTGDTILWGFGVGGSWLEDPRFDNSTHFHSWVMSFHWSITQFTPATTDIAPVSTLERMFAIASVFLGMLVFSVFLSSVTTTVNQLKALRTSRVRERHNLLLYIKCKLLPPKVGAKILEFFDAERGRSDDNVVESDVPILAQLPESVRISMHREYFLPMLKSVPIIGSIHHVEPRVFLQICHSAMSDQRYVRQEDVFLDGIQTKYAYNAVVGSYKYCQMYETSIVEPGEWIAEAALWLKWTTQGSLVACSCSTIVKLDCEMFGKFVLDFGGQLHRCLRCCASLFAYQMELYANENYSILTDMPSLIQGNAIAAKALKFCNLPTSPLRGDTVESHLSLL